MKIPQLDLKREYDQIKDEVKKAVEEVMASGRYILGPKVKEIEQKIAEYSGAKYGIGVASGSDALLLGLMAFDIKQGDAVITTPFTFFATASAIYRLNAYPLFVDIEDRFYNIDPERLRALLEKGEKTSDGVILEFKGRKLKVRGIIPVHLFGYPADMDPIMELAKEYDLFVLEDAAQSIGAEYKGKKVGSFGDIGIFSFFPTKNLGTYGDGGMVITSSEEIAYLVRILRVHGAEKKYYHLRVGINSRLDEIHAAVLIVKFKYLEDWIKRREKVANYYAEGLKSLKEKGIVNYTLPESQNRHVWNQFVIQVEDRENLKQFLKEKGIGFNVYYPRGLHLQPCFKDLGYQPGDFPITESLTEKVLALPMHPFLTEEEQDYIIQSIEEFYRK